MSLETASLNNPSVAPPGQEALSLRLRLYWHHWRNRLLMSQGFQRFCARTPLLRSIGNRQATKLHDITAGFVYSAVLEACVRLDLFEALKPGPLSTAQLCERVNLEHASCATLLNAAASLSLLDRLDDDLWGLGMLGAATAAYPGIGAMVNHHALLYRDLCDPVSVLQARRPTALSHYWPYAERNLTHDRPDNSADEQARSAHYSGLMAESLALIADHVLDACSLRSAKQLLDIGGGTGGFACAALTRHPQLKARVVDLPQVVSSEAALARDDAEPRLQFTACNVFEEPLPLGADVISLIRILHDHDDDKALQIIRAARAALPEGGQLLIAEPMAGTKGAEAIGHAYFGFYLWVMGSGRPRTAKELGQLLRAGGFSDVREHKSNMPSLVRIHTASAISGKNY